MRHLAMACALAFACLSTSAKADDAGVRSFFAPLMSVVEQAPEPPRTMNVVRSAPSKPLDVTPARAGIVDIVLAAGRRHGVPAGLMYGVIATESGFNPRAHNRSGATGLGQLLPSTARGLGCRGNLYDPSINADCAARYLARTLARARGNQRIAAALYNQGEAGIPSRGARYAALVMARARRIVPT